MMISYFSDESEEAILLLENENRQFSVAAILK